MAGTIGKRIKYYSGYFQDDWKLSPNLTINLGIRYEFETPITEVADRMNNFDLGAPHPLAGQNGIPEGAIGVVTFPNRNGIGKYLWRFDKNNVSPRFGFAWRVFGSDTTVIRGGFGIFYGNPYDRNAIQPAKAGFDNIYIARHPVPFRLQDGVPAGALADIPESELLPTFGSRGTRFATSQIEVFDPNRVTPYTENFNLTIAKQWKEMVLEVGYLGNLGRHISFPGQNINLIRPEDLPRLDPDHPNTATAFQLRPWQGFTSSQPQVQMRAPNWGLSNAHLFTFKAERRYQNGFGFTIAYTHTQWIDNLQFTGGGLSTFGDNDRVQNIYNLKGERSRSTNGIPHRVVIAPIIDLPFGRGRRWGSNWGGIPNAILGGWQFSTIATIRSGAPFGAVVLNGPRDILGDSAAQTVLRPDLVSSQLYSQNKGEALTNGDKGLAWLNPDAFADPADFTHGNASRTLPGVLGPGRISFDAMVAKNVRWGEDVRLQFRWEMFNALNTPQFGLPNQNFGRSAFGQVGGAGGRRIMQFGLKLYW